MQVSKYHGCGNDFIIVRWNDLQGHDIVSFVKNVCHRQIGVGADGCILVKEQPLEMIFYNADGTRAPMCGNGIRCFAKYCYDEDICTQTSYEVKTLAGIKHIAILKHDPFLVRVAMGCALYDHEYLHLSSYCTSMMAYTLHILHKEVMLYTFFMSTIHTVIFVNDAFSKENELMGDAICHHPLFLQGTNVNFVQIVDKQTIHMQTYERGVGMTLACGTGACASALIAYQKKNCQPDMDVIMKQGHLHIEISANEEVFMSGPAIRVLKGEYYET